MISRRVSKQFTRVADCCFLVLSCSNDTSIKLWMLPHVDSGVLPELALGSRQSSDGDKKSSAARQSELRVNSFHTINSHQDYVRAMAYSRESARLFSISDDGMLVVNDLHEGKMAHEYRTLRGSHQGMFGSSYIPVFDGNTREF